MSPLNRALDIPAFARIEDLRFSGQRRVPKAVFDDLDGGAKGK
jgi:hypothetical protein